MTEKIIVNKDRELVLKFIPLKSGENILSPGKLESNTSQTVSLPQLTQGRGISATVVGAMDDKGGNYAIKMIDKRAASMTESMLRNEISVFNFFWLILF